MRSSDTGQCLGVHQTLLHCAELELYVNAKLTSKLELASLGGEMRLILGRVCSGEWSSGDYLRPNLLSR